MHGGSGATAAGIVSNVAANPFCTATGVAWLVDDAAIDVDLAALDGCDIQYGFAVGGPKQAVGQENGCGDGCVAGFSLQQQPAASAAGTTSRASCGT